MLNYLRKLLSKRRHQPEPPTLSELHERLQALSNELEDVIWSLGSEHGTTLRASPNFNAINSFSESSQFHLGNLSDELLIYLRDHHNA